jgi:hypothetical protein
VDVLVRERVDLTPERVDLDTDFPITIPGRAV